MNIETADTETMNTEMKTDTLVRRVLELAVTQPDKPALIFRSEIVTYREYGRQITRAAALLKSLGIKRGDRVLYTAVSKPQTFVLFLGIQYLGAVAVPTDKAGLPEGEISLYESAGASLLLTTLKMRDVPEGMKVITQKEFFASLGGRDGAAADGKADASSDSADGISADGKVDASSDSADGIPVPDYEMPDGEDLSEILFTSGTTGKPKGVMLSFRAVYHILQNTRRGIGITEEDRVLMPLPLHHSLALRVSRATLYAGGTLVLQNGFAFAKETETNQVRHRCTGFAAVPVSMELLLSQMKDHFYEVMGAFRFIEIGAGALTVEQRKRLSAKLPNTRITNTWGSSETGGVIFADVHDIAGSERRVSSLGRVIDSAELRFIPVEGAAPADPCGTDSEHHGTATSADLPAAPCGTDNEHPGRLALRGGMVMSGYFKDEEQTRDALRDGWLVTNDLAYVDEDGYVFMLGRSDDIINIGGEKLSPLEMENAASEYEGAAEYACIGVPDPKGILGQVPVLFVGGCRKDYDAVKLKEYLASKMTRLKLPARICEVEALPRNRMQKLDRKALADLYKTMQ